MHGVLLPLPVDHSDKLGDNHDGNVVQPGWRHGGTPRESPLLDIASKPELPKALAQRPIDVSILDMPMTIGTRSAARCGARRS
jgi:hypothetical protein